MMQELGLPLGLEQLHERSFGKLGQVHGFLSQKLAHLLVEHGDNSTGPSRSVGHSWPRDGSAGVVNAHNHWISSLDEAGCAPGVNLVEMGGPIASVPTVGSGGGYGGFHCFALTP